MSNKNITNKVYSYLCHCADKEGIVGIHQTKIADRLGCSIVSVKRAYKSLKDKNLLSITKYRTKFTIGYNSNHLYKVIKIGSMILPTKSIYNNNSNKNNIRRNISNVLYEKDISMNINELYQCVEEHKDVIDRCNTMIHNTQEIDELLDRSVQSYQLEQPIYKKEPYVRIEFNAIPSEDEVLEGITDAEEIIDLLEIGFSYSSVWDRFYSNPFRDDTRQAYIDICRGIIKDRAKEKIIDRVGDGLISGY